MPSEINTPNPAADVAIVQQGVDAQVRLFQTMEKLEKSVLEVKAQRDDLLNAAKKGLGALYEIHGQGIGCPDCPPGEDRGDVKCGAILMVEAAIARVEAWTK